MILQGAPWGPDRGPSGAGRRALLCSGYHDGSMPSPQSYGKLTKTIALWAVLIAPGCSGDGTVLGPELPPLPEPVTRVDVVRGAERTPVDLVIALVAEVRGEIEPCGCPTLPFGGFVRRERALTQLREEGRPVFHLDAGNLLVKGAVTRGASASTDRADLVLRLSAQVGVDAWVPGPADLVAVEPRDLSALPGPRAISATWEGTDGALLLPPFVVLEQGDVRLAVIGLSADPGSDLGRGELRTRDPVAAARAALLLVPNDVDLVVALGSVADADADRVAREVPGIAAILTTRGTRTDPPRAAGALVVEAADRGRYLEVVRLLVGGPAGHPVRTEPAAQAWRNRNTLRVQAASGKQEAAAALAALDVEFAEAARGRTIATTTSVPLSGELDGPAETAAAIEAFKVEVLGEASRVAAAPVGPAEPGFAGSGPCLNCHSEEFTRWSLTPHAAAFRPLITREQTVNPECLGCHTTGFGEVGGFGEPTTANVRKFKAVQCEACHGPMRGHPEDPTIKSRRIDEALCVTCHDDANSPQFDYGPYLRRASCQAADGG
jgi:Cytochrome c554 and c-prime